MERLGHSGRCDLGLEGRGPRCGAWGRLALAGQNVIYKAPKVALGASEEHLTLEHFPLWRAAGVVRQGGLLCTHVRGWVQQNHRPGLGIIGHRDDHPDLLHMHSWVGLDRCGVLGCRVGQLRSFGRYVYCYIIPVEPLPVVAWRFLQSPRVWVALQWRHTWFIVPS